MLKQNLDYKNIFKITIAAKVTSFVFVISIAYTQQTYWALVIGDIIASIVILFGSYLIHNYKPSLSLKMKNQQWHFSKWMFIKSIVGYIRSQIDTVWVSKIFSSGLSGQYYMVRNIAMLPCQNILSPAIEPLIAAFRINRKNSDVLKDKINFSLFIITLITIPMVVFINQNATLIVSVLL